MLVPVYDIVNCGPRKRFVANGKLVHNSDKVNLQNLPSRGKDAKVLKRCIVAPKGHIIIDADSAQIEARVLAWFAKQYNIIDGFSQGEDVYKNMASVIYNKPIEEVEDFPARFVGKQAILGAGYGMGAIRFQAQLLSMGVEISKDEAYRVIKVYREVNSKIVNLWNEGNHILHNMMAGDNCQFGRNGMLEVDGEHNTIKLPSGLHIRYDKLEAEEDERGTQFSYWTRNGRTKIYGGKLVENVTQALARCIIGEQMLKIAKRYRVLMTVHDSIICCVPHKERAKAIKHIANVMRTAPDWAKWLPLDCDVAVGPNYGDCENVQLPKKK